MGCIMFIPYNAGSSGGGGGETLQYDATDVSDTWTCPAGVTEVTIWAMPGAGGGAGGGRGGDGVSGVSGGGGAGGTGGPAGGSCSLVAANLTVVPGTVYTRIIGAGGAGGAGGTIPGSTSYSEIGSNGEVTQFLDGDTLLCTWGLIEIGPTGAVISGATGGRAAGGGDSGSASGGGTQYFTTTNEEGATAWVDGLHAGGTSYAADPPTSFAIYGSGGRSGNGGNSGGVGNPGTAYVAVGPRYVTSVVSGIIYPAFSASAGGASSGGTHGGGGGGGVGGRAGVVENIARWGFDTPDPGTCPAGAAGGAANSAGTGANGTAGASAVAGSGGYGGCGGGGGGGGGAGITGGAGGNGGNGAAGSGGRMIVTWIE